MAWTSVHLEHAVERVRFEIRFAEPLPKKIVDGMGLMFDGLIDLRFEQREMQQTTTLMIGPNGQPMLPQAQTPYSGWTARRVATKHNLPIEAVILDPSALIYESSDYKGWSKAVERFQSVCGSLLEEAGRMVNAGTVIHDYVDRFIFIGDANKADPTSLLEGSIVMQLPAEVKSGKSLWHLHRGWFETIDQDTYLVNQNFDAQDGYSQYNKPARSVQVYTKMEFRPPSAGVDTKEIGVKLEAMHHRCNDLVAEALTVGVAEKIGLGRSKNNVG